VPAQLCAAVGILGSLVGGPGGFPASVCSWRAVANCLPPWADTS